MQQNDLNNRIKNLIKIATEKSKIKEYYEFCKTENSDELKLSEEEEQYYYDLKYNKKAKKYEIGDIVFVSHYKYKNGSNGKKHIFVIISDSSAVDIDYFGFLISSQMDKLKFPYNKKLNKSDLNKLHKNSIVKCDDLIRINENEIEFKIGEVTKKELEKFILTYEKYLEEL